MVPVSENGTDVPVVTKRGLWWLSCADRKVLLLGWAQVCFDFAVTIFWLLWIPTLVVSRSHSEHFYIREATLLNEFWQKTCKAIT